MKKHPCRLIFGVLALFLMTGCATVLVAGGAAVGAGVGTYFYVNGELRTDYAATFERTWQATERTIADLRGTDVIPVKEIARGKISALINDEKVSFDVSYKTKDLTTVGIRVGLIGSKASSQRLHDKITEHLAAE